MNLEKRKVGIIGLGYVGLPLCVAFAKKFNTIGFDKSGKRIQELKERIDITNEVNSSDLEKTNAKFTDKIEDLLDVNFFIIAVPTPIDSNKEPDMSYLISASELVGKILKPGDYVVYESTVYPGATEEICIPILKDKSDLQPKEDFFYGYSPERINPGDKERTIEKIIKVTSGCGDKSSIEIDNVYKSIIQAGTYLASSVKVAEAAKVIENTQRDINIGLMNELAIIFDKEQIDTYEVLEAAQTKWNFLPFKPGLVGGHCIGVDPYYLTYRAKSHGINAEIILSGRNVNDNMPKFVSNKLKEQLKDKGKSTIDSKVLVLGITFKENCPDTRNSKVVDLIHELKNGFSRVDCFDPIANKKEVENIYNINLLEDLYGEEYDSLIFAVAHEEFTQLTKKQLDSLSKKDAIVFDLKNIFPDNKNFTRL